MSVSPPHVAQAASAFQVTDIGLATAGAATEDTHKDEVDFHRTPPIRADLLTDSTVGDRTSLSRARGMPRAVGAVLPVVQTTQPSTSSVKRHGSTPRPVGKGSSGSAILAAARSTGRPHPPLGRRGRRGRPQQGTAAFPDAGERAAVSTATASSIQPQRDLLHHHRSGGLPAC